ncbi:MAG: 23S rRNA pseudouridine(1911/1915/1917) synthase [gamma proteobacterium symbiont of Ctena orbiculata]|uniref:Pseudouridine synthase n=1 Tax=Candidatus Thiodiazotropha taylori TaxID=2792791 RepID=A0A944MAM9_9GAMM|nr:23S rRNA pseudouridine(1911/1915/1917) synthase RluD [Candidatus Thiodiazotropha taylori]PUB86908.1 MAG: 23S rRNA pseudouridine(1911/1915/1917) synthase RluD [gamma proteobacterium symbiont of Ctena orbiculata]MBV2135687.1 23S rRNA pseudouridine(1911/1915/1917) synthase RluD [Candidatus Thiodiazotropha taylori]PVV09120.1 MAG: 23S rRNA pseudouridine(1911/1915/1917) synthase [gamma proteobacterium symbiont of Ctena orbiculata]PVV10511.1 MAG: 23S rRNA pseudouridine(1911/1915/1917) synthase [gam
MSDANPIDKVPARSVVIPAECAGSRLDQVLSDQFPEYSRSRLQQWIKLGLVELDGAPCKAKQRIHGGERINLRPLPQEEVDDEAQAIDLDILYEDEQLLVINKPPGLVMHPAAGNPDGTLLNGLLNHHRPLQQIPRAGIVHRLDKETSGLLVVAKTLQAQHALVEQLQARRVKREYLAIVQGQMIAGGTVDAPIGRHPVNRLRMAVNEAGKQAITHYRIEQRFPAHTLLRVRLETGRTHQIRVHMHHIRHPLLGDPLYGGRLKLPPDIGDGLRSALQNFRRQALHAARLELLHPESGELVSWEAPLPLDMRRLIDLLAGDAKA